MNKNIRCLIALFQISIYTIGSLNACNISYSNIKNEHAPYIKDCIETIFPNQLIAVSVKPLVGGLSGDDLYLIETKYRTCVFRCMAQPHSLELYHKDCMYVGMASEQHLGPRLLYQNSEKGCYATEFVEGEHLSPAHLEDVLILEQCASALSDLHNASVDLSLKWDVFARIKQEIERKIQAIPQFSAQLDGFLGEVHRIESAIKRHAIEQKTCHNDVHSMNLFYTPEHTIQFIDWGNAGLSDPFWDLACSAVKFHLSAEQTSMFLEKYFGAVVSPQEHSHFILMKSLALLSIGLNFLDKLESELDSDVKKAVNNYLRKTGGLTASLNTFEDAAAVAFSLFEKMIHSCQYSQACMLLEQL